MSWRCVLAFAVALRKREHSISASSTPFRRGDPRIVTHLLRPGLVILTALLIVAAVYTSTLIVRRQATLRDVSRYNATWLVSQAGLEVGRLTVALAAFNHRDAVVDPDEVRLRLDIVINRLEILTKGDQGSYIKSRADLKSTVSELEQAVAVSSPIVDALQSDSSTAPAYAAFVPLLAKLNHLAASVHERGAELVERDMGSLERLSWVFSGLLISLILCSFGLIALTRWNYRMLETAHERVGCLANDLHIQNARFYAALSNMSQGLCMGGPDGTLVVCNDRFRELFALREAAAPGTSVGALYELIAECGEFSRAYVQRLMTKHAGLIAGNTSAKTLHEDEGRSLALAHEPMPGGGWVTTYEDTTEQRAAEARISFMAKHDVLTGLPNRLLFRDRLWETLPALTKSLTHLAVLCLDLDRFKQINDSLGHPAGDLLLKIVATRLRNCISKDDTVARLGGDEFVVFCTAKTGPLATAAVAQRIIDSLGAPYDLDGHRAVISASIGIIETADPTSEPDLLLKNADLALYKARAEGRATFRFFEAAMETELLQRRSIEMDLAAALENGSFEVHYQPLFGLPSRTLVGFEALLRWRHPERGLISPVEFIPIAEDTGIIEQIGAWVLAQACADAASWPEPKKIAVNLSAVQFASDIVGTVTNALQKTGLPPQLLELEITETILLRDNDRVLTAMRRLKELGVRTALDDFGTGYSALSYLRIFPFDKIKIDRAFVRDISEREDSKAIVTSIVQLAAALGMTTTAEGVETASQLAALRDAGCDEVQGFFFARPEPAEQLPRWFGRRLELVS